MSSLLFLSHVFKLSALIAAEAALTHLRENSFIQESANDRPKVQEADLKKLCESNQRHECRHDDKALPEEASPSQVLNEKSLGDMAQIEHRLSSAKEISPGTLNVTLLVVTYTHDGGHNF